MNTALGAVNMNSQETAMRGSNTIVFFKNMRMLAAITIVFF